MKPKYLQVETAGRDRWMISYLDVLTILLIFFVAVGAQSLKTPKPVEPPKTIEARTEPARPSQRLGTPEGVAEQALLQKRSVTRASSSEADLPKPELSPLRTEIQQKLDRHGLEWHAELRGLVISLPQAVLFPPGKAEINAAALSMVANIADVLDKIPNKINLAGHADPVPIHNRLFKSNWELAAARSLSLLDLLTTRYGISESRFLIARDGGHEPADAHETTRGRASNRLVEIVILDEAQNFSGGE